MRDINGWVVSYPLTNMRDTNGWVVSGFVMKPFFVDGGFMLRCGGFYIISDNFFTDFPDPYLKMNKSEHRPHYFALYEADTMLYWMIPMSSKAEKYQKIVDKRSADNKPCDTLHLCRLDNGVMNAFLIQDMFPIIEEYVSYPYTVNGNALILTSERERTQIERKARRVMNLLRSGTKFTPTQPDVLKIEAALLSKR